MRRKFNSPFLIFIGIILCIYGIADCIRIAMPETTIEESQKYVSYTFRNSTLFYQHYAKHGREMGFSSAEEYLKGANDVINNPDSLHKRQREDNDEVYYLESTGEFVVVSTDGYIRTYFYATLSYYNRQ